MSRASDLAKSVNIQPLIDGLLQSASFTAVAGRAYVAPVGGTIILPTPTGSRQKIEFSIYGNGITTLSGTINGVSSFAADGDQTFSITDADVTRGWV